MMIKIIKLILVCCVCAAIVSCRQHGKPRSKMRMPLIPPLESGSFPAAKITLDSRVESALAQAEYLFDFIQPVKIIQLEYSDASIVAEISGAVLLEDRVFIQDRIQNQIFCFDLQGRFQFKLGRMGQGPGEYASLVSIQKGDDYLIAADSHTRYHFYNFNGDHQYSTPVGFGQGLYSGGHFAFNNKRIYATDFGSYEADAPAHAIVDFLPDRFQVLGGFGQRFLLAEQLQINFSHSAIELVNQDLWLGSPYHCMIDVYDRDGRKKATLQDSSAPFHRLKQEHFKDIHETDAFVAKMFAHRFPTRIHQLEDLVLVQFFRETDVYDTAGNFLKHLQDNHKVGVIHDVYHDQLLFDVPPTALQQELKAFVDKNNPNLNISDEDNPYLVIYKIKHDL